MRLALFLLLLTAPAPAAATCYGECPVAVVNAGCRPVQAYDLDEPLAIMASCFDQCCAPGGPCVAERRELPMVLRRADGEAPIELVETGGTCFATDWGSVPIWSSAEPLPSGTYVLEIDDRELEFEVIGEALPPDEEPPPEQPEAGGMEAEAEAESGGCTSVDGAASWWLCALLFFGLCRLRAEES